MYCSVYSSNGALKLKGQKQPQKQLKFLPYGFLKNLFWLES